MTAFDDAFYILKNEYSFDLTHDSLLLKGKFEEANQLRGMREFVLENENSADPSMRQAAEDMYQRLTAIMSAQSRTAPMQPPEGPVGEGASAGGMSQPPEPPQHPMMKAWANLKKNVIGMQDGQEYNMPDPIASMAQRRQVPETMTQTTQTPAPGMFGRFKQPETNRAEIPTGQMSLGQRPPAPSEQPYGEGAVQPNAPHPMGAQFGVGAAPGAEVTRMPAPHPYEADDRFANEGYQGEGPATPTSHTPNFQNMNDPTVRGETRPPNIRPNRYPEDGGAYPREVGDESAYYYQQGKTPENVQRNQGDQFNPSRDMSFQSGDKYEPGYDSMRIDKQQ